jgi:hypothetical protein
VPAAACVTAGATQRTSFALLEMVGVTAPDDQKHETALLKTVGSKVPVMAIVTLPLLEALEGDTVVILGHEAERVNLLFAQVVLEWVHVAEELQKTHSGLVPSKQLEHDVPEQV